MNQDVINWVCNLQLPAGSPVDIFGNVTEVVGLLESAGTSIAVTIMAAIGWFTLLGVVVVILLLFYRNKKKRNVHSKLSYAVLMLQY